MAGLYLWKWTHDGAGANKATGTEATTKSSMATASTESSTEANQTGSVEADEVESMPHGLELNSTNLETGWEPIHQPRVGQFGDQQKQQQQHHQFNNPKTERDVEAVKATREPGPPLPTPPAAGQHLQQPPSPRTHMIALQEGNPHGRPALSSLAGPLERYLAQDDMNDTEYDAARIEQDRRRLRAFRPSVFRKRAQVQAKRKELREKAEAKTLAEQSFMKFVRENIVVPASLSPSPVPTSKSPVRGLEYYYGKLQASQDEYGPSEYECYKLEESLDDLEFELAQIEGRLYNYPPEDFGAPGSKSALPPQSKSSPSSISILDFSFGDPQDYHPLHASYLERLGDLDLARERYNNTRHERESLVLEQELKARVGLEFDEDLKRFLAELPLREAALQTEIAGIEANIDRLRVQCLDEGIDVDEPNNNSVSNDGSSDYAAVDSKTVPTQHLQSDISHSMFPLLLPDSDEKKAKLEVLFTEFDEANKGHRINRWLLYKLQTSPLEVDLLARVFLHVVNVFDFSKWPTNIRDWQLSVLSMWEKDGANIPPEAFKYTQTTSFATHPSADSPTAQRNHRTVKSLQISDIPSNPKTSRKIRSAPSSVDARRITLSGPEVSSFMLN
ncbi:uncharacterized protein BP5553_09035 [Venustampulla echinocandica]|uniref:Uncharacterized protein n=1 Tax=Venustampulla echinocandica TaxID=2656787 RepID=A0A370TDN5_9HELO|nr:uncharacterized protein BP5553_09035 [Venustampulla echinocandica]RDL32579.1 hypothetical protein BP5553_09035 [Venustampulla echinocandica]